MGVRGAAYATVIGQFVSLLLAMVFHYTRNRDVSHAARYLKPQGRMIGEIYKIGIPAAVMQALVSVMSYGLNVLFGMVSSSVVTAYGVYYKMQQFIFFATLGMNNALIPILGFNYGRRDRKRLLSGIKWGIGYSLVLMFVGALCLQLFARPLVGVFSLSAETESLCIRAVRIATCGYLIAGVNITSEAIFQAFGDGVKSLLISLTRLTMVLLAAWGLIFTLAPQSAVWWAIPLSEALSLAVSTLFLRRLVKNVLYKLDEPGELVQQSLDVQGGLFNEA